MFPDEADKQCGFSGFQLDEADCNVDPCDSEWMRLVNGVDSHDSNYMRLRSNVDFCDSGFS